MEPADKKRMAERILGEYPDEYLEMLEFIDRFPDLQETPAQFQERCGQVALKCFWNETHAPRRSSGPDAARGRPGQGAGGRDGDRRRLPVGELTKGGKPTAVRPWALLFVYFFRGRAPRHLVLEGLQVLLRRRPCWRRTSTA